jgi:hypothetical protein
MLAIFITVSAGVTSQDNTILGDNIWTELIIFSGLIFWTETLLKVISFCSWGTRTAYFYDYANIIDLLLNIWFIFELFSPKGSKNLRDELRIIRILKVPSLLPILLNMTSLKNFLKALQQSWKSISSVAIVGTGIGSFFAIIGVQVYQNTFSYCSYDNYPQGENRYHNSTTFPNGCSGNVFVENRFNEVVEVRGLHWKTPLDSFDDIFAAARSIFRIMMSIEWGNVLYSGLDYVGYDIQPKNFNHRESFLFFFTLNQIGVAFLFVTAAMVYYHYFIISATFGRKRIFGEGEAFWCTYEVSLCAFY